MPDDETIQAAMYGPLVLAGRFDERRETWVMGLMGRTRSSIQRAWHYRQSHYHFL